MTTAVIASEMPSSRRLPVPRMPGAWSCMPSGYDREVIAGPIAGQSGMSVILSLIVSPS